MTRSNISVPYLEENCSGPLRRRSSRAALKCCVYAILSASPYASPWCSLLVSILVYLTNLSAVIRCRPHTSYIPNNIVVANTVSDLADSLT